MAAERDFFPQSIEGGTKTFGDERFVGFRFTDADGQVVNILFRPEAAEAFADQFAALREAQQSAGRSTIN
jgi:hypothetical protein